MATMLESELIETIRSLDASLPANPDSAPNRLLAERLERDLRTYFKRMAEAIDWEKIERFYYENVKAE